MINVTEEKEKLTQALTEQYSKSVINLDDYESMIEQVTKADSIKELRNVQKQLGENCELTPYEDNDNAHEQKTVFSWRNVTAKSINGNAGNFTSVFGTTQIRINDLPAGKTTLKVKVVFGLIEIFVPKNVKIENNVNTVFSAVFAPNIDERDGVDNKAVLNITGKSVFGNVSIIRK
jgi:predicted membrane protein